MDENNSNYASVDGVLFDKNITYLMRYPIAKTDTTYTIPNSVTRIYESTFYRCGNLTAIYVENGNQSFASVDGVLYSKDLKTLWAYPIGDTTRTSYDVLDSATFINCYAFATNKTLSAITIGENTKTIAFYAFDTCYNLSTITFKNTSGWHLDSTTGTSIDVSNPTSNATNLTSGEWQPKYLYRE